MELRVGGSRNDAVPELPRRQAVSPYRATALIRIRLFVAADVGRCESGFTEYLPCLTGNLAFLAWGGFLKTGSKVAYWTPRCDGSIRRMTWRLYHLYYYLRYRYDNETRVDEMGWDCCKQRRTEIHTSWTEYLKVRAHFEDLCQHGRRQFKCIFKKLLWMHVDSILLVQVTDHWRAAVNTVMNLDIQKKRRRILWLFDRRASWR